MRSALAVVSLVSAVVGGIAVIVVGAALGLLGQSTTKTVVVAARPAPVADVPVVLRSSAKPLPRGAFDAAQVYAGRSAGVVTIYSFFGTATSATAAQGSGFVVSRDGTILTDAHVVTNAGENGPGSGVSPARAIFVEFNDHDRIPARVVGWDVFDDVGVIRVEPKAHTLAPVPLGHSSRVRVGEPVAAIGSPLGNENSLAVGVVSAVKRSIASLTSRYQLIDAIQTDAPITHGNSGGPLFDGRGRVIGINAQIRSQSGGGNDAGIGFAVPIDSAKRSMEDLLRTGGVRYAYIGATTEDLTPSLARHLKLSVDYGAMVDSVIPGAPAAAAGLLGGTDTEQFEGTEIVRGGDVIVAIDGIAVRNANDLVRIVSEQLRPGQIATFSIVRAGTRRTIAVRLGQRPSNPHNP
ncbi:MAG: S1C family serine protease [Gaiellaceae bacterium]